jgi:hypothetical protein
MNRSLLTLLLLTAGCSPRDSGAPQEEAPVRQAREYVAGWRHMGMYLPDSEIPFFAHNYESVTGVLAEALADQSTKVRIRAAYVISQLGSQAVSFEPAVLSAIENEPDRTTRLYFYRALASAGATNEAVLTLLKKRYDLLPRESVKDTPSGYTTADERIVLASALYVLDANPQAKGAYYSEVVQWLKPPEPSLRNFALDLYWDHRWSAVIHLEDMHEAHDAIPLLEAMLTEKAQKSWVTVHVPRVLSTLKKYEPQQEAGPYGSPAAGSPSGQP